MGSHHSKPSQIIRPAAGGQHVQNANIGQAAQLDDIIGYLDSRLGGKIIAIANDALSVAQSGGYTGNAQLFAMNPGAQMIVVRLLEQGADADHYKPPAISAAQEQQMANTWSSMHSGGGFDASKWTIGVNLSDQAQVTMAKALFEETMQRHPPLQAYAPAVRVVSIYNQNHTKLNVVDLSFVKSIQIVGEGETASVSGGKLLIPVGEVLSKTEKLACYATKMLSDPGEGCSSCLPKGEKVPPQTYALALENAMNLLTGAKPGFSFVKLACPDIIEQPGAPISLANPNCRPLGVVVHTPSSESTGQRSFYLVAQGLVHYSVAGILAIAGQNGGSLTYGGVPGGERRIPPSIYAVPTIYPAEDWAGVIDGFSQIINGLKNATITCGGIASQDNIKNIIQGLMAKGYIAKAEDFSVMAANNPLVTGIVNRLQSQVGGATGEASELAAEG